MSRNVNITPKTADVHDTREHGITQQQQQQQNSQVVGSKQCGSRFQAGDDDTEAPPVPRRHEWEAQATRTTRDDEEVLAETCLPQRRKKSAPQLAPAMEPEIPQQTVTPSATAAPSTMTANDLERGEMATPPPPPPPPLQRPALVPGAFQVTGPGVHRFGRRRPSEDQRTVMTPVAAEVVRETPLVVAVPEPPDEQPQITANWWTKRRNQRIVVAGVLTLVATLIVVVSVLIMSSSDDGGGTSLPDATPPPTNPQTPPMTLDPTTAFPTTAPPTNTTVMMTQSPTTLSPSTPVPTTDSPTMTMPTTVPTTTAWQWKQMGQDIGGEAAGDLSGGSISLSTDGTTVAIGAWSNDGNGSKSGHIRVYQWNGSGWVQLGNDMDGEAEGDFSGESVSLSPDSTTVAIGATGNSGNGDLSGHVRVYQWDGGQWVQLGNDMDGEVAYDLSGESVSLSANGTTVAIGTTHNNDNGAASGHVRVYQWNGGDWAQLGNDMDGEVAYDSSGWSVSLSWNGTTVAIGAPGNDDNGFNSGHVRVYQWKGGTWNKLGNDIDGEAAEDSSGRSVSLSADGTTVAIGAPGDDASYAGQVRVFQLTGNDWIQVGSDLDGKSAEDQSGKSVSLSADGTTLAIGAPGSFWSETKAGYVRVYQVGEDDWIQVGSDLNGEAVGDCFGASVSLSEDGSTLAVGAPYNDGTGSYAGHVRVYRLEEQ